MLTVRKLELRIDELEKPVRDIRMEWEDWFEKFRNLYGRLNKRRQRDEADPPEQTQAAEPRVTNPLALRLMSEGR